jgi:uncharacterized coiled-coil DUF342 family protein
MSDAAVTTIVTGLVTIIISVVGFLTMWVKLKYGAGEAVKAAHNVQRVESKIDKAATAAEVVATNLAHNTELTSRIEKQTNGPLSEKLELIEDHSTRIAALEAKVEGVKATIDTVNKNLDSTRHEVRGHLQTLSGKLDLIGMTIPRPVTPPISLVLPTVTVDPDITKEHK